MTRAAVAALAAVLLGGCGPQRRPLYAWGHYEDTVYETYAKPDEVPPERQIEQMEEDYQHARSENLPVPPGWHAQLGYLYYKIGKVDQARQEFTTEKSAFPESTTYMNLLLAELAK